MIKSIHATINQLLSDIDNPTIFEIGAHKGEDTEVLALVPNSTVHAFECDPRNMLTRIAMVKNVRVNYAAVSDKVGTQDFWLSEKPGGNGLAAAHYYSPKHTLTNIRKSSLIGAFKSGAQRLMRTAKNRALKLSTFYGWMCKARNTLFLPVLPKC